MRRIRATPEGDESISSVVASLHTRKKEREREMKVTATAAEAAVA